MLFDDLDPPRRLAAFDIEIWQEVEGEDWKLFRPLGISCAALAYEVSAGESAVRVWRGAGAEAMTQQEVRSMVTELQVFSGLEHYQIVTWNGLGFDFDIVHEEAGLVDDQVFLLALLHVDLMANVLATRGHYLGLDKAAKGSGVASKLKKVVLSDGSELDGMDGAQAPRLWQAGEAEAVLSYLRQDVLTTLALAQWVRKYGRVRWTSSSGRVNDYPLPFERVADILRRPLPDTSWMSEPPRRGDLVQWIPEYLHEKDWNV